MTLIDDAVDVVEWSDGAVVSPPKPSIIFAYQVPRAANGTDKTIARTCAKELRWLS